MAYRFDERESTAPPDGMRPSHHVDGDMLLAYAAGTLAQAPSLVVATHLSLCPACRASLAAAEAVGGALLDDIAPEPVSRKVVADVLTRLDAIVPDAKRKPPQTEAKSLAGAVLPRCVLDYLPEDLGDLRWSWVSPGVKFSEMLSDGRTRVGLMQAAAGAPFTPHGHSGPEVTMVLSGGYRDGAVSYQRGDVQSVDESDVHEPVVDQATECLALFLTSGPVKPTGLIARIVSRFIGF